MTDKLTTASVLAFERKLDPSDAVFHAGRWDDRAQSHAWQPVTVRAKSVRGTISNRLKAKDQDPAKLDAAIENPNLQTVDVAALPAEADTLKVQFTLRVLGGAGTPSACNSAAYQAKLLATVQGYVQQHGFGELARRYALTAYDAAYLLIAALCTYAIGYRFYSKWLAARVLTVEHQTYATALKLVASGQVLMRTDGSVERLASETDATAKLISA